MRVAVVGAGINGIMCAWALARAGHRVTLFERGEPMNETSSASTKLLHGGLRYLEHGNFRLVREGLRERAWWLQAAPHLTRRIEIVIPVYRDSPRGRWRLKLGLVVYDRLAGATRRERHRWLDAAALLERAPRLRAGALAGGYVFFDGQMDDRALGLWALGRARRAGVELRAHSQVERVDGGGGVEVSGAREIFDRVVNAAGPWAGQLLERSGIAPRHLLDLVRGSHLLLGHSIECGFLLQSPDDGRVCFVLPWQGRTLVGTTEVRQGLDDPIACNDAERDYLLRLYNAHFSSAAAEPGNVETFAGVRPLLAEQGKAARAVTRESAIETNDRLVTVFGGKWTTSRALGERVAALVR